MAPPVIPIPALRWPDNAVYNWGQLGNALTDMGKGFADRRDYEFDRERWQAQEQRAQQRHAQSMGAAGRADQQRQAEILTNIATTIKGIQDPNARRAAWTRLVQSQPNMARTLRQYGQDPADFINGPDFIISQTRTPEVRQPQPSLEGLGLDEEGRVTGRVLADGETAAGGRSYGSGAVDFGTAGTRSPEVPGVVTAPRSGSADPLATQHAQGQRAVAGASPEEKERLARLINANRKWTYIYGKPPPAGSYYNEQGDLVDLRARGQARAQTTTQRAAVAGTQAGIVALKDAKEALQGTTVGGRLLSHLADTGTMAVVTPNIEIATRSVMHGLSGAQVNIPETESYLRAFMPQPGRLESLARINNKLSHLELMLGEIARAQGGAWSDEQTLKVRNDMRRFLGLRPKTLEEHMAEIGRVSSGRPGGSDRTRHLYDKYGLE